jgi:glycosyltransferase involved in cell wall biosynthesis
VSVRIPTKDRAWLLEERSLPSVIYQTYQNLEIVIVGDYCTDWTEDIINQWNKEIPIKFKNLSRRSIIEEELMKDPEIRWFMGPVRATNAATEMCSGEWIVHLDDDDIWTPDHIERSLDYALKNNYDFVSSKIIRKKEGKFEEVGAENGFGGCQTWLYKKSLADLFPYNPECYKNDINRVSDTDVADRIQRSGAKIGFLNIVGAYVLPRPGETTVGLDAYKQI